MPPIRAISRRPHILIPALLLLATGPVFAVFGPDFERNVKVNVIRAKNTRVEGGDFDDKKERISMRIQLKNRDLNNAYTGYSGKILVFSRSQKNNDIYKVVLLEEFPISVEPRSEIEIETKEVVEGWDDTGAIWGYRYRGWVLKISGPDGETVAVKSSSPRFEGILDHEGKVHEGTHVDKDMRVVKEEDVFIN